MGRNGECESSVIQSIVSQYVSTSVRIHSVKAQQVPHFHALLYCVWYVVHMNIILYSIHGMSLEIHPSMEYIIILRESKSEREEKRREEISEVPFPFFILQ